MIIIKLVWAAPHSVKTCAFCTLKCDSKYRRKKYCECAVLSHSHHYNMIIKCNLCVILQFSEVNFIVFAVSTSGFALCARSRNVQTAYIHGCLDIKCTEQSLDRTVFMLSCRALGLSNDWPFLYLVCAVSLPFCPCIDQSRPIKCIKKCFGLFPPLLLFSHARKGSHKCSSRTSSNV